MDFIQNLENGKQMNLNQKTFLSTNMVFQGSFSYLNQNFYEKEFSPGVIFRISGLTPDIARIHFVKDQPPNEQIDVPVGVTLVDKSTGVLIMPFENSFMIVWTGSYSLNLNNRPKFRVVNQKQQAVISAGQRIVEIDDVEEEIAQKYF